MSARAKLVSQAVEQALVRRVQSPFACRVREPERTPFGVAALSETANGGAPQGAITELVGPACSGRTTAAYSLVRSFSSEGGVCAWIDVADALSPGSASANGIDLQRLLWVRCRDSGLVSEPALGKADHKASSAVNAGESPVQVAGKGPHPRTEARNMPEAIQAAFAGRGNLLERQEADWKRRRSIGTPGAPNRPLTACATDREEQVAAERLPPRRGEHLVLPKRGSEMLGRTLGLATEKGKKLPTAVSGPTWKALDAALRATDLLLANGGFAAIVLDLGSTPAEFAWRIPLATWFRYRAACEQSRCSLLVLTQHPCARSSAGLVLRLEPGSMVCDGPVLTGVHYRATLERSRFAEQPSRVVPIRKAPRPERAGEWTSEAVWA